MPKLNVISRKLLLSGAVNYVVYNCCGTSVFSRPQQTSVSRITEIRTMQLSPNGGFNLLNHIFPFLFF